MVRKPGVLILTLALVSAGPGVAAPPATTELVRHAHQFKVELIWREARERFEHAREVRERLQRGERAHPAPREQPGSDGWVDPRAARRAFEELAFADRLAAGLPPNVRCNDPGADSPGSGQAEESVASQGNHLLVGWNDGQGFEGQYASIQGYGHSSDGGASFTDGGFPPLPGAGLVWDSDPSVTVNEKTGEFYFCAMIQDSATGGGVTNGLATVRATFSGGAIQWSPARIVETVSSSSHFYDKEWIVADSTTGNLYLTYTHFVAGSDSIVFRRSTDGGVTWGPKRTLNSLAAAGLVQGSRPAVGPGGEVYAIWFEAGAGAPDYFKLRRSTDAGATFGSESSVGGDLYRNFGTGAPGFNRPSGLMFPSLDVDRTTGAHRGRVYVAWNESVNWMDDPFGTAGARSEVENNNFFAGATPFTPGQVLRGAFGSAGDVDHYSFAATQGSTLIFWCDSIPNSLYSMRIHCGLDTLTRLAYAADLSPPAGGQGFIVWSAPATSTYFLRMFFMNQSGSTPGGYRIETAVDGPSAGERARDHRDAFVAWSDDAITWTTSRVNDEPPGFDDWLPEVAVASDGNPYAMWFDWRDAPGVCAGASNVYMARSEDGGMTWAANSRVTTATTHWTVVGTNLIPNQGDYSDLGADADALRPVWADGRDGSPDVFTAAIGTGFSIAGCRGDTTIAPGGTVGVPVTIANANPLYANDYTLTVTIERDWPLPPPQPVTAAAFSSAGASATIASPDSAAPGPVRVCARVVNASGSIVRECCSTVTLAAGPLAAGDREWSAFALSSSLPNPATDAARIDYVLPREGEATLRVYGLRGEVVRTLVAGHRPAGRAAVVWDLRDEHGRPVPSGTYFYRLESSGRSAIRRLAVIR